MKFINLLAVILIVTIFVFFGLVVFKTSVMSQMAHDIVLIVIGALTSSLASVIQYYFGSSQGSAKKNETIDSFLNKNQ